MAAERNLLSDEDVIFRTKKHLIIFFFPLLWTLFCFYAAFYMQSNDILSKVEWVPWLLAFIFWTYVWLEYFTSDFIVTNKRIIMREGFFNKHTNDLRLSTISQVNVDQSIFGQIFSYGTIGLNAFGAYDTFSMIADPFGFQKAVNEQIDEVKK